MIRRWYRQWKAERAWRKLSPWSQLLIALDQDPKLRKAFRKALHVRGSDE